MEEVLSSPELVRVTWLTLWAFIRISTNRRVYERPLTPDEAQAAVESWLALPNVDVLEPGERHLEILGRLLTSGQATGPLVMDAALAAIAMEHGATLCSTDRDFARFSDLSWRNPLGA